MADKKMTKNENEPQEKNPWIPELTLRGSRHQRYADQILHMQKTEEKTKMKMTKSIQVWWNRKLVDVVSDEEARKLLADGNAMQVAENMIKITPRWW